MSAHGSSDSHLLLLSRDLSPSSTRMGCKIHGIACSFGRLRSCSARVKLSQNSLAPVSGRPNSNLRTRRAWPICTPMKAKRSLIGWSSRETPTTTARSTLASCSPCHSKRVMQQRFGPRVSMPIWSSSAYWIFDAMSQSPLAAWFRSGVGRSIVHAQIVVGLWGSTSTDSTSPWMDGLMQFVQVDASGRPEPLVEEPEDEPLALHSPWCHLRDRARKLLHVRQ